MTEKKKERRNCQNCGKPIQTGLFCSTECGNAYNREPQGAKPLDVNHSSRNSNPALDDELKTRLTNTQWQKGLLWRQEKTEAVAEARQRGISEKEIFVQLKRSGLTDPTARKIMDDARYCE
jgi:hypothetical protein